MIEKIRQYSETWWFKTFLGLIALTFVLLWGGGDLLNQVAGNRQTVATVGDTRLTSWEFEKAVNRELTHISRQVGRQITPQEALDGGVYHSTLLKLVDETLVELEALRLGLSVSDQAVREAITKNPLFQSQEGTFNKQNFLHLLSRLGYTETGFVEEMRRDMTRTRLFDALFKGISFPPEQANFLYRWQEQTRQLSYAVVDSAQIMIKDKPTPPQLATFFEENATALKAPEFRDVTVLIIDAKRLAAAFSVTREELQKAFDERAPEFEGKKFSDVKSILEKDLKHSKALEKAYELSTKVEDIIAGGATLSEVAQQLSLPLKDVKKIDVKGNPDLFKTKDGRALDLTDLDRAIAAEAFALDPQVTGSAIEVKNGLFFVAHVDKVYPAKNRAQQDVHPRYAQHLWQESRKREKLLKIVENLKKSAGDRGQLAIAANKNKVRLQSVKVSRKGASIPSSLALTPRLLADIFGSKKGASVVGLLKRSSDNPAFLVGIVEAIYYPATKGRSDELDQFEKRLSEIQKEDFSKGYITSLRKRFAVNINQRFMKSLKKTSGADNL